MTENTQTPKDDALNQLQTQLRELFDAIIRNDAENIRVELPSRLKQFGKDVDRIVKLLDKSTETERDDFEEAQINLRDGLFRLSNRLFDFNDVDFQDVLRLGGKREAELIKAAIDAVSGKLVASEATKQLARSYQLRENMGGGEDWGSRCMVPQIFSTFHRFIADLARMRQACDEVLERKAA